MTTAYSGALVRAVWGRTTTVPGVDPRHTDGTDDADPFRHEPVPPAGQAGDIWQPTDTTGHTDLADETIHHWTASTIPVPSSVPAGLAQQVHQNGMVATHGVDHYRADTVRAYTHATIEKTRQWIPGRSPWYAGETISEGMEHLLGGHNAYDQRNQPNEVYSAEGGRYRLGAIQFMAGDYHPAQKIGQDAVLRAYEPMHPRLPVSKTQPVDPPPVIPPSSGTATWVQPAWQRVRSFTVPPETQGTAYLVASDDPEPASEFFDDGRL
jgi:hypothetical protein